VNPGRAILINLLEQGFPKSNVFIVKPNVSEIEGCKCVADISQIPSKVDVFVLSVDASQVPSILEDLNKHNKTNSVILISGGMAEKKVEDIEHKVMRY
jgi:acyl-CoA synthetase (NDP forming)